MHEARSFWLQIETLHAVTYFGDESRQAARDAGLPGFWRGYFAVPRRTDGLGGQRAGAGRLLQVAALTKSGLSGIEAHVMAPAARTVAGSELIPYPNAMGLPRLS